MSAQPLNLRILKQQVQVHLSRLHESLELLVHGEANVIFRLNRTVLMRVAVNTPAQRFAGAIRRVNQFEQASLEYLQ